MIDNEDETVRIPPCNPQEILKNMEVISEGKKGDGTVKYDNYIIFVSGAKLGETVDIKIEKVFKNFALAKIYKEEDENNEEDESEDEENNGGDE